MNRTKAIRKLCTWDQLCIRNGWLLPFMLACFLISYTRATCAVGGRALPWELFPKRPISLLSSSNALCYLTCYRSDGEVTVWGENRHHYVQKFSAYDSRPNRSINMTSITISSQASIIEVSYSDGTVASFSIASGKLVDHFGGNWCRSPLIRSELIRNGSELATVSKSGKLTVVDLETRRITLSWQMPTSVIAFASISPNGRFLATDDGADHVRVISVYKRQVLASTLGSLAISASWSTSQNPSFVCVGTGGHGPNGILLWSPRLGHGFRKIHIYDFSDLPDVAISPNGRLIAISDMDYHAVIVGANDNGVAPVILYKIGSQPDVIGDVPHGTSCMTFSPNDRALIIGSDSGSVKIWRFAKTEPFEVGISGVDKS